MNDQAPEQSADPTAALLDALNDSPEQEEQVEEVEAQAEEAPEEEPEEAEEAKPEVSQKFRVKVKNDTGEDEERDLSLEELAAGYMQSADYTRKTQAAAAQEKQRQEQFFEAVSTTAEQAKGQLRALHQFVMASIAPELQELTPQLAATDPARYVQLQAKQMQVQQVLGAIAQQDQELTKQQRAALNQKREQSVRNSLEYLSREIPGFNLEKDYSRLVDGARKYGYGEDLAEVSDGRFIHMLHDAMKWRELQTAKPKAMQKVAEAPKVLKPSAPQPKKQNASAMDRLKKTGRAEELMNFL